MSKHFEMAGGTFRSVAQACACFLLCSAVTGRPAADTGTRWGSKKLSSSDFSHVIERVLVAGREPAPFESLKGDLARVGYWHSRLALPGAESCFIEVKQVTFDGAYVPAYVSFNCQARYQSYRAALDGFKVPLKPMSAATGWKVVSESYPDFSQSVSLWNQNPNEVEFIVGLSSLDYIFLSCQPHIVHSTSSDSSSGETGSPTDLKGTTPRRATAPLTKVVLDGYLRDYAGKPIEGEYVGVAQGGYTSHGSTLVVPIITKDVAGGVVATFPEDSHYHVINSHSTRTDKDGYYRLVAPPPLIEVNPETGQLVGPYRMWFRDNQGSSFCHPRDVPILSIEAGQTVSKDFVLRDASHGCGPDAPRTYGPSHGVALRLPRAMEFGFGAVKGAVTYTIEIETYCSDCQPPTWKEYYIEPQMVRDDHAHMSVKLEVTKPARLRWRVWGFDSGGHEGDKSPWSEFRLVE